MNVPLAPVVVCSSCKCYPCRCRLPRREPCACGGWIEADPKNDTAIRIAVENHVKTPGHEAWAIKNGLRPEKETSA